MRIADAQPLWEPAAPYWNIASYGLAPQPAWEALQAALADGHTRATSSESRGDAVDRSRASFASLVGVDTR